MRILLDECVPKPLKREFDDLDLKTVGEMGWLGTKNGALLQYCPKVRNRINKYKVGSVVTATVKIIKNYGVIVNIKNDEKIKLPGLIKKDEISFFTINNLNHIFKVGQEIKAIIIETNLSLSHFSRSTKALEEL